MASVPILGQFSTTMRKKLDWVTVLNEQTRWRTRADFRVWYSNLTGKNACVLDGTIDGFEEALGFMRRQFGNLHFEEPVDLLWLDTQLKTVSFGLLHHQGMQEGTESLLPRFRARVKGMSEGDLVRAVKDSLLMQFAEFVGDVLDSGTCAVLRCQGVYRESEQESQCQPGDENETRWQDELPVLANDTIVEPLRRCPMLFHSTGGRTRFCSDNCRLTTTQIAKQATPSRPEKKRVRKETRVTGDAVGAGVSSGSHDDDASSSHLV